MGLVTGRQKAPLPDPGRPQASRPRLWVCSTSRRARRASISNIQTTAWRGRGFRRMGAGSVLWQFNAAGSHVVVAPVSKSCAPPRKINGSRLQSMRPIPQDKPRWSPDGNLLYYISEADGFRCIRARRLDPATKRPIGQPLDVYHSHSARRSLMNAWIRVPGNLSEPRTSCSSIWEKPRATSGWRSGSRDADIRRPELATRTSVHVNEPAGHRCPIESAPVGTKGYRSRGADDDGAQRARLR